MKKLYLVDVSSLFFRAFYAIRPLTSPSGLPVNAIYGYLSMIIKLIKTENPDYIAFCYDVKEPSFRKEMYSEYKANRTEMPEDLVKQMPYLKKLADLLGIKDFEKIGFEADDLIGTLTEWGLKNQLQVIIVSGDKDFAQLVKPHVFLLDTMKETLLDTKGVIEKWGVDPVLFCDYLALVGDSSDNVPGVSGVGPKGAIKLIQDYGNLDQIYQNIEKISGKIKEKLVNDKKMAYLSKELVTIEKNAPLQIELADLEKKEIKVTEFMTLLDELNFQNFKKSLLDGSLLAPAGKKIPLTVSKNETIASDITNQNASLSNKSESDLSETSEKGGELEVVEMSFNELIQRCHSEVKFNSNIDKTLDSELFLFCFDKNVYGLVSSEAQTQKVYKINMPTEKVTISHKTNWFGFDIKGVWTLLNIKFLVEPKIGQDIMLDSYVIKSKNSTEIEDVIQLFLNEKLEKKSIQINTLLPKIMAAKRVIDSELNEKKKSDLQLEKIIHELEYPLVNVLYKMEQKGFQLDVAELKKFSFELESEIKQYEKEICQIAGEEFNVNSPKQLGVVLFQKMGLESTKKTKTGFSTDNDVLEKLNHPIAQLILKFRESTKLKSTYVDALPLMLNPMDHRVHTTINQALTTTGRLSSSNPNLQNIPIKTEKGQRVRKSFISEDGKKLLSLDYSQIELRVLAHFSEDPGLIKAFMDDVDIHAATAAEVFGIELSQVTSEQRRIAKAVNFGIAYGQGAFGLSETLGIPRGEATQIINQYFIKFKNVKNYIEDTIKSAHENGYVETLLGRKRFIYELRDKNAMIKKFGERAAINAPIQGTASDIVKKAMIEIDKLNLKSQMILQVHDELLFEESAEVLDSEVQKIKEIMENVTQIRVPLKVNFSIGSNWEQAH